EQGGLVGIPHPFDRFRGSMLKDARLERLVDGVDWIETHNARIAFGDGNQRAAELAVHHGRPGSAVSGAHSSFEGGGAYTAFDGGGTPRRVADGGPGARPGIALRPALDADREGRPARARQRPGDAAHERLRPGGPVSGFYRTDPPVGGPGGEERRSGDERRSG